MNLKQKVGLMIATIGVPVLSIGVALAQNISSSTVSNTFNAAVTTYWDYILAILLTMVTFAVSSAVIFLSIYFVLRRLHLIH